MKKICFFFFLTLFILGPLFLPGYVFLLDFVVVPRLHFDWGRYFFSAQGLGGLPFELFRLALSALFGAMITQKILLSLPFFLGSYFFYRCLPVAIGEWPRRIGAMFFVVNPFVYERFMAGHIHFLLGYMLAPVFFLYLFRLATSGTVKDACMLALIWTAQIAFEPHFSLLNGILAASSAATSILLFHRFVPGGRLPLVRRWALLFLAVLLLNSYWLWPTFFGQGQNPLAAFTGEHFLAYQSAADKTYGLGANLLGLYGFWRERTTGEILLAKDTLPVWPVWFLPFFLLAIIGARRLYREKKFSLLTCLLLFAGIGFFISVGPAGSFIGQVNMWLFRRIPGFAGLRESQKALFILPYVYSVLLALGVEAVQLKRRSAVARSGFLCAIIFLLAVYTYPQWWGAWGQVRSVPYPQSFLATKTILDAEAADEKTLVMPWHLYIIGHPLGQGRTITDPLPEFLYPHTVIRNTDEEMSYTQVDHQEENREVAMLAETQAADDFAAYMTKRGIHYIFISQVTRQSPYPKDYSFLTEDARFHVLAKDSYGLFMTFQ